MSEHNLIQATNNSVAIGDNARDIRIAISSIETSELKSLIHDSLNSKENEEVKKLREKLGVTEQALSTFFTILKKDHVDSASLPDVLCEIALNHRIAIERLNALSEPDSAYNTQIVQVRDAIKLGEYKSAKELLLLIIDAEKVIAKRAKEVRKAAELEEEKGSMNVVYATAELAEIELIELNYLEAANYFKNASDLTPTKFMSEKITYLVFFASAMRTHGEMHGDNKSINISINAFNQILSKESCSEKWASIQDGIGIANSILGGRTGEQKYYTAAIKAYQQALGVLSPESTPQLWASTQNNLGIVYSQIGCISSNDHYTELAIIAFQSSLMARNTQIEPKSRAITLHNIGAHYLKLRKLDSAINSFKQAEEVFISINDKENLARVHTNLSATYYILAQDSYEINHLKLAESFANQALNAINKINNPIDWGLIQRRLGDILFLHYQLTNIVFYLNESKNAYQQTLSIFTKSSHPTYWPITYFSLGKTLSALGKEVENIEYLKDALLIFESTLETQRNAKTELNQADIKNYIGIALCHLKRYQKSIVAYTESLEVRDVKLNPVNWADTQNNLGVSYRSLGLSVDSSDYLETALNHFDKAKYQYKQSKVMHKWILAEQNYGDTLSILGIYKKDEILLKHAIKSITKVISCYKNDIDNPNLLLKYEQNLIHLTANLTALS